MQANYTRDAVFHAERLPVFVGHNPDWAFEPHAEKLSLTNAWWLCNLSQLAYYDEADAIPVLERMGLTFEAFIDDRKEQDSKGKLIKDTQALIVSNDEAVMVVFRGTEPDVIQDILTDANLPLVDFPGKGKVHSGFYEALSGDCWQHLVEVLQRRQNRHKALWISGHSLGAALAMVAAAHLQPAGIYDFGSPRVGDSVFCASFQNMNFHRFANCCDLVTQIPLKGLFDYQHGGILQYFDGGGNLHTEPHQDFIERDQFKARFLYPFQVRPVPWLSSRLLFRKLVDHAVVNYAYGIWKNLNQ
ncbi:lipase family protein [Methylomonas sp. MgM2]